MTQQPMWWIARRKHRIVDSATNQVTEGEIRYAWLVAQRDRLEGSNDQRLQPLYEVLCLTADPNAVLKWINEGVVPTELSRADLSEAKIQ